MTEINKLFFNVFFYKKKHEIQKKDCFLKIVVKKCFFLTLSVERWEWGGGNFRKKILLVTNDRLNECGRKFGGA